AAARVERAGGDGGGDRLGPAAGRALVRRRDGRGAPARARGSPPRARRGARRARAPRRQRAATGPPRCFAPPPCRFRTRPGSDPGRSPFRGVLCGRGRSGPGGRARRRASTPRGRRGRASALRRRAAEAAERRGAIELELARPDAERADAQRRLDAAGAEPVDEGARDELAAKLERLERRREQLGQVNPLAREEYEAEKERLDELSRQRGDLEEGPHQLQQLRRDPTETVERRLAEAVAAVEGHFADVAATLFPGGEGRLRLTEDDDGEHGIEVELRPAGKRITRLSLLSGGEKALGAIAFLFSLFLARPSPFYLLDEVEAALDGTDIGLFTSLLRRYAQGAQVHVVTHQKRTMEAADVLYGVTMGPDGLSQIVSRRLPHEEEAAATA